MRLIRTRSPSRVEEEEEEEKKEAEVSDTRRKKDGVLLFWRFIE